MIELRRELIGLAGAAAMVAACSSGHPTTTGGHGGSGTGGAGTGGAPKGACVTASDCPPQTTLCKSNTCDPTAHTCGATSAAKGTACTDSGGTVCDGNGTCVAASCVDGIQDGNETDLDCGGSCGGCADGKKCKVGGDCVDKVCDAATQTCTPASCSDGVQNGMETDVDCGGATCDGMGKTCADTLHCAASADCANGFCFGSGPGTCVSCMDGVQDGNETGTDCGGAQCDAVGKTCGSGKGCGSVADCAAPYVCNSQTKLCEMPIVQGGLSTLGVRGGPMSGFQVLDDGLEYAYGGAGALACNVSGCVRGGITP